MASTQHIKKVGTRPCLPLCGIPFLFITVCKRLGTEETSCSSLGIGMLSHSCLIQASSCSTVLGLLCRIFLFMMRQMFSMGERSGLKAGHFSTRILLRSHDVCNWCSMVVWHCHVGKCKVFPERDGVWMGAYVVLELGYTFQHWWCLSRCVSCHATRTHATPYHQRCRLLNWAADNNLGCPCPLSPDDMASQFSKKNFKFWFVWPQNSFPLCHSPF